MSSISASSEFDRWLSRQLYLLDRKEFFDLPAITRDGGEHPQTDNSLLYARCACGLAGREAFSEVLNGQRSFLDFTEVSLSQAEFLLSRQPTALSDQVWERLLALGSRRSTPAQALVSA